MTFVLTDKTSQTLTNGRACDATWFCRSVMPYYSSHYEIRRSADTNTKSILEVIKYHFYRERSERAVAFPHAWVAASLRAKGYARLPAAKG